MMVIWIPVSMIRWLGILFTSPMMKSSPTQRRHFKDFKMRFSLFLDKSLLQDGHVLVFLLWGKLISATFMLQTIPKDVSIFPTFPTLHFHISTIPITSQASLWKSSISFIIWDFESMLETALILCWYLHETCEAASIFSVYITAEVISKSVSFKAFCV